MVVTIGVTEFEPDATNVTAPTAWSIENVLVFVVVHDSAEDEPACTAAGFAESVHIGAGVGGGGAEQVGTVMVSVSVVSVPPNANALPVHVLLAPTVMPAAPMTVPANVVLAASVVAAVGVQKTSHADAPVNVTTAPAVEVSAPTGLKMKVPLPLRVRGPPTFIAPELQYTPGAYTPIGPCVASVERLTAPPKLNVHGCEAKADKALPWSVPAAAYGAPDP